MSLLLNEGATKPLHIKTAVGLISTWLFLTGPLFLSVVPRSPWRPAIVGGWLLMVVEAGYLVSSWGGFGSAWFVSEWLLMFTHGLTLVAFGVCLAQMTFEPGHS